MEYTNQTKKKLPLLPNSTMVLVFGILSIITCSFIGLVFGIISLIMSKKQRALFIQSPESYSKASLTMVNAGNICAIIGTIISSVSTILMILYFVFPDILPESSSDGYHDFDD